MLNQDAADRLCAAISVGNKGLKALHDEDDTLPSPTTVLRWLKDNKSFRLQYACAKEAQADFLADEIREIADNELVGEVTKITKDGTFTETGDNVQRSKLMVDTRKWLMSKLLPKKYGDRTAIEHSGEIKGNLPIHTFVSDEQNPDTEQPQI